MTAADQPLLQVRGAGQQFPLPRGRTVHALNDVSLNVHAGETLGVVGESGCGKSTLLRSILLAPRPRCGSITFEGHDLLRLGVRELRRVRSRIGMVFQDPTSSLDPRFTVRDLVAEPLTAMGMVRRARTARADELLEQVGLDPKEHGSRRAPQLSGGQLQRIAIARALATDPPLLLCDEVVSALDVSVQAQVINVLEQVRSERGLGTIFVSHDLSVVRHVSDRIAVMHLGSLVEIGPADEVYHRPAHPYTRALVAASPHEGSAHQDKADRLRGELPSPVDPPSGCTFRTRCPVAQERCATDPPLLRPFGNGHLASCHFPLRVTAEGEPTSIVTADRGPHCTERQETA